MPEPEQTGVPPLRRPLRWHSLASGRLPPAHVASSDGLPSRPQGGCSGRSKGLSETPSSALGRSEVLLGLEGLVWAAWGTAPPRLPQRQEALQAGFRLDVHAWSVYVLPGRNLHR